MIKVIIVLMMFLMMGTITIAAGFWPRIFKESWRWWKRSNSLVLVPWGLLRASSQTFTRDNPNGVRIMRMTFDFLEGGSPLDVWTHHHPPPPHPPDIISSRCVTNKHHLVLTRSECRKGRRREFQSFGLRDLFYWVLLLQLVSGWGWRCQKLINVPIL